MSIQGASYTLCCVLYHYDSSLPGQGSDEGNIHRVAEEMDQDDRINPSVKNLSD